MGNKTDSLNIPSYPTRPHHNQASPLRLQQTTRLNFDSTLTYTSDFFESFEILYIFS